jgi:anaerobic selenocysteine-containing dehydrogenase
VNGTDQSVNAIYRGRGDQKFENILWEGAASIKAERIKKYQLGQSLASLLLPVCVEVKLVQGLGRGRV